MSRDNTMSVFIGEFVFDTVKCHDMFFWYDPDEDRISNVFVSSNFSYTDNSTKKWCDDCSYGSCHLELHTVDVWKELAECIRDLEWQWKKMRGDDEVTPIDGAVKTKLLQHMLNAGEELEQFILHTLQNNQEEIQPDAEGWIKVDKLWATIRCEHTIYVSREMLEELLEKDGGKYYMVNEDKTMMKLK